MSYLILLSKLYLNNTTPNPNKIIDPIISITNDIQNFKFFYFIFDFLLLSYISSTSESKNSDVLPLVYFFFYNLLFWSSLNYYIYYYIYSWFSVDIVTFSPLDVSTLDPNSYSNFQTSFFSTNGSTKEDTITLSSVVILII